MKPRTLFVDCLIPLVLYADFSKNGFWTWENVEKKNQFFFFNFGSRFLGTVDLDRKRFCVLNCVQCDNLCVFGLIASFSSDRAKSSS